MSDLVPFSFKEYLEQYFHKSIVLENSIPFNCARIDELNESKQVGILYHFTKLNRLEQIIKADYNFLANNKTVSLTRNKQLNDPVYDNEFSFRSGFVVRFVIDGDKISESHYIQPLAGMLTFEFPLGHHKGERVARKYGENEEAVFAPKGTLNMKPFIIGVDILNVTEKHRSEYNRLIHLLEKDGIAASLKRKFA